VALALLACLAAIPLPAQEPIPVAGHVVDRTGAPVAGATVAVEHGEQTTSGADGAFSLHVFGGAPTLRVSCAGYEAVTRTLDPTTSLVALSIVLEPAVKLSDAIVVQAVRADAATPVTKTDLEGPALQNLNYGQEMPFVLQSTPSATNYSESGMGGGYAYFYLRGIQQTRINMTLDGAPLNDPEESAVYFANFGDFASALESVQIQRGVGTSTVGSASYGGSINFASTDLKDQPEISARVEAGSYGTERGTVAWQSGRLGDSGIALDLRASGQTTDGFRNHSGLDQLSLYFGASRQAESSFVKLFGFAAHEKTHLAFIATDLDVLEHDLRFNPMQPEETDSFGQEFLQIQGTRLLSNGTTVAAQAYYNGAQGWFDLWDDETTKNELQRYGIDGYFTGGIVSVNASRGNLDVTWGAHASTFARDHFLDIVSGVRDGERLYTNTGHATEENSFVKLAYSLPRWQLYGDAQVRHASFRYDGSIDLGPVSWTFFNPKVGARFAARADVSLYATLGRAGREPARNDLLAGEDNVTVPHDLHAVKPESVTDAELGGEWRGAHARVALDVYAMEFHDEIALAGKLSDIGLPLRANVDRSYRRGVELDAEWRPAPSFTARLTANLSRNRIDAWTQFYDVYDVDGNFVGQQTIVHRDVQPLLTPTLIVNPSVDWRPRDFLDLTLLGREVGRSFLDNTNRAGFETPSYFQLDLAASLDLQRFVHVGEPRLRLQVNNVLDNRRIWPSGYDYLYFQQDGNGGSALLGTPSYYPQATRSFYLSLELRHR
jgi:iron complex outermembrane receptor protein